MPTYRNDTGINVVHRGETVEPGATLETMKYMSRAGLTKLSDAPYYNPYQFYTKLTYSEAGSQTITIPDPTTCYSIRLQRISSGITVTVYLGDKTANPVPIALDWDIYDPILEFDTEYSVGSLIIEASGAGTVYVIGMSTLDEEMDDNE